jgi:hypothetical protein
MTLGGGKTMVAKCSNFNLEKMVVMREPFFNLGVDFGVLNP